MSIYIYTCTKIHKYKFIGCILVDISIMLLWHCVIFVVCFQFGYLAQFSSSSISDADTADI